MTTKHPSDTDIQQYALGVAPEDITGHVNGCSTCQAKAVLYCNLFIALRERPAPAFDFDVAALVLSRIPARRQRPSALPYLAALGMLAPMGVIGYLFREDLTGVFSGAVPMFSWLTVTAIITILGVQGADMLKTYRKQMREFLQH